MVFTWYHSNTILLLDPHTPSVGLDLLIVHLPTTHRTESYDPSTIRKKTMSNSSSSHSKNGSTNDTSTKLTSSASSIPQTSDIISNLIEEANRLKLEGNSYFTTQNYEAAQVSYSRALKVIQSLSNFVQTRNENANTADTTGGKSGYQGHFHRIISMRVTLCSNQSHALNNLGKYEEADTLCTEILSILENHILNLETIEDSLTWSQNKRKVFFILF